MIEDTALETLYSFRAVFIKCQSQKHKLTQEEAVLTHFVYQRQGLTKHSNKEQRPVVSLIVF